MGNGLFYRGLWTDKSIIGIKKREVSKGNLTVIRKILKLIQVLKIRRRSRRISTGGRTGRDYGRSSRGVSGK